MRATVAATFVSLLLGACATFPNDRLARCGKMPTVTVEGDESTTTLSVLTYNVEGLPWPARRHRAPQLRQIALELRALRTKGQAPDVVLLQEAFTPTAASIGNWAGYASYLRGPDARTPRARTSAEAEPKLIDRRKHLKGETLGPLLGSGLYILSDYPVIAANSQPFRVRECAGFDCLSKKGMMHSRIFIPGVPRPVDLFNTHLNSRRASGVSRNRSLLAHRLQIDEFARFIEANRDPANPIIFGGDFNMRHSPRRFERFELRANWSIVHQYCAARADACDVRLSWDGDEPWMDTQDLQGFDAGTQVAVRPIRVEAMFDAPWRGRPLADHEGLLTVYKLSWPRSSGAVPAAGTQCV